MNVAPNDGILSVKSHEMYEFPRNVLFAVVVESLSDGINRHLNRHLQRSVRVTSPEDVAQSGWRNGALTAQPLALSAPPALAQLGHGVRT